MKIIDWEKEGNMVRFYLGENDCTDYHGDDWDDRPYSIEAGHVYDQFVKKHIDIAFPFDWLVVEPQDDWRYEYESNNREYCMNDFKERKLPFLIVVPDGLYEPYIQDFFSFVGADIPGVYKFYLGDNEQVINPVGRSWVEV